MKYMLDTNICIYLIKQNSAKVLKYFKTYTVGDIGLFACFLPHAWCLMASFAIFSKPWNYGYVLPAGIGEMASAQLG
jgi:hypothetical protein